MKSEKVNVIFIPILRIIRGEFRQKRAHLVKAQTSRNFLIIFNKKLFDWEQLESIIMNI